MKKEGERVYTLPNRRYCKTQDKATKHKVVKSYVAEKPVIVKVIECTECGTQREEW